MKFCPWHLMTATWSKQIAEAEPSISTPQQDAFPIAAKMLIWLLLPLENKRTIAFLTALRQHATVRQLSPYAAARYSAPNKTLVVGIYADTATPWKKQYLPDR